MSLGIVYVIEPKRRWFKSLNLVIKWVGWKFKWHSKELVSLWSICW
jgi:hypothetical protein